MASFYNYPDYGDWDGYFANQDFGDAWSGPMASKSEDERRIEALAEAKHAPPAAPVAECWDIKAQDCTHQFKGKEVGPECEEVVGFVVGEFTHRWLTLLRNEWATRPQEAR